MANTKPLVSLFIFSYSGTYCLSIFKLLYFMTYLSPLGAIYSALEVGPVVQLPVAKVIKQAE